MALSCSVLLWYNHWGGWGSRWCLFMEPWWLWATPTTSGVWERCRGFFPTACSPCQNCFATWKPMHRERYSCSGLVLPLFNLLQNGTSLLLWAWAFFCAPSALHSPAFCTLLPSPLSYLLRANPSPLHWTDLQSLNLSAKPLPKCLRMWTLGTVITMEGLVLFPLAFSVLPLWFSLQVWGLPSGSDVFPFS